MIFYVDILICLILFPFSLKKIQTFTITHGTQCERLRYKLILTYCKRLHCVPWVIIQEGEGTFNQIPMRKSYLIRYFPSKKIRYLMK